MIIYLSGPMTGLPDHNHAEFNKWASYFRDRGHQVLNPAENDNGSKDKARTFYMRLDIEHVLQANVIILLPNWLHSAGSKLEVAIAQELGIPCYALNDFLSFGEHAKPLKLSTFISIVV